MLLEQRGIAAPPRSLEEFLEQARQLTFRPSGAPPVTGLVMTAALAAYPVMFAHAFGGDFITPDYRLMPDPSAMIRAIAAIRGLFEAGALPRGYATTTNEDQVTSLQQGRAAFAILPFSRHAQLNRPEQSRFAGRIRAMEMPMSSSAPPGQKMAAAVEFWSMAIPANARDKLLAWSFIQAMSSPEVTLGSALNGNGPVRLSTYADAGFSRDNPVAAIEADALARARVPFPAFAEASRAEAIFVEEVQSAVLGRKEVEDTGHHDPREAAAAGMMLDLGGRRALVTGGRRGLGRVIAAALVRAGARVAIFHEGPDDAGEAAVTAAAIGSDAVLPADLADTAATRALVAAATQRLGGPVGILVCDAAFEQRVLLDAMVADEIDRHWAVNVRGSLELVRAALPGLRAAGDGRVLLLGSVQQWRPNPHQIAYAASKAAIGNLGRNLARQLAPEGIRVNILCPGAIETEGNAAALADPAYRRRVEERIPAGRLGRAEEVATAAVFLCSAAASYISGAELLVDGGLAAG
ncbi:MAG: transcriptional antiterminator [Roseomonas sp.]|nr:transcriptional antiterminator [Roseomonas sp.]